MIYAYTTPGVTYHDGYIKIGYTEQDVYKRIRQQTHTAGIKFKLEWQGNATFDDGSGDTFKDTDFHAYLRKFNVKQPQDQENNHFPLSERNEWFKISPSDSKEYFNQFRTNRGIVQNDNHEIIPYVLREEQDDAVKLTIEYRNTYKNGEFLWNAKPRFGKTLSTYDFILKTNAEKVLIVTNRPAIANSWYEDYEKFIGRKSGYFFVSNVEGIKDHQFVLTYEQYKNDSKSREKSNRAAKMGLIEFISLQDLKGSIYFGGKYDKLKEIKDITWDILVIDEAHEGVDTYKTDIAFDHINRGFTLHLSGTPFKALANNKFPNDAIYNWTYADEQRKKRDWNSPEENPYANLPTLNLFTYQMSKIIEDELSEGIEINGEAREYAFDLNEFFATNENGFIHDSSVNKFLDALTTQEKFPFSSPDLREELKHTLWLLNRVESAKKLAEKLEQHPIFKEYEIILAVGNGKIDDDDENKKSYDKVVEAIKKYEKTITLSVGQLTTGITIPEWTGVLMLSNIQSPALYMQAAFRAQNPCLFHEGNNSYRKENAYVFDFDPARTLIIFEQFANELTQDTASGHGDSETRKKHIKELLNFFPVIGEDEDGKMIELDAEKVLSIPRKIKSQEVVRSCFMSNFLFQNISNVFRAPEKYMKIIFKLNPVKEKSNDENTIQDIQLDENNNVSVDDEYVIGLTPGIFGEKIYEEIGEDLEEVIKSVSENFEEKKAKTIKKFKDKFHEIAINPIVQKTEEHYGTNIKPSDKKQVEQNLVKDADRRIEKIFGNYNIQQRTIEKEYEEAMANVLFKGKTESEIQCEFEEKQEKALKELQNNLRNATNEFSREATNNAVKTVEIKQKERIKSSQEFLIKDHLRGLSRTIPAFMMAYGDENVTLDTFDTIIPDNKIFYEITNISLDEFRSLRNDGNFFDPIVFNDSLKEFMRLKYALADYFDETNTKDIFDYIPAQKTNQIFTPKNIVKTMVDMLEKENPGCFNSPNNTFIDPYMKSGMYIAEIVKRLYRSKELKQLYPDRHKRLKHIFEKQVYGLAPTDVIYKIATNFILGFDKNLEITKHNFCQVDALPYAKEGNLEQLIEKIFG